MKEGEIENVQLFGGLFVEEIKFFCIFTKFTQTSTLLH